MARPRQPLINRSQVFEEALALIDAAGIDSLSMRSLASKLGVNAASLYHHFSDKDEILDGVAQLALVDKYPLEIDRSAPWDEQIIQFSVGAYRALMIHPNLVPMLFRRMDRGFAPASHHRIVRLLVEGGIPDDMLMPVLDSFEGLLIGLASIDAHAAVEMQYELQDDPDHLITKAVRSRRIEAEARFEEVQRALLRGWQERLRSRAGDAAASNAAT